MFVNLPRFEAGDPVPVEWANAVSEMLEALAQADSPRVERERAALLFPDGDVETAWVKITEVDTAKTPPRHAAREVYRAPDGTVQFRDGGLAVSLTDDWVEELSGGVLGLHVPTLIRRDGGGRWVADGRGFWAEITDVGASGGSGPTAYSWKQKELNSALAWADVSPAVTGELNAYPVAGKSKAVAPSVGDPIWVRPSRTQKGKFEFQVFRGGSSDGGSGAAVSALAECASVSIPCPPPVASASPDDGVILDWWSLGGDFPGGGNFNGRNVGCLYDHADDPTRCRVKTVCITPLLAARFAVLICNGTGRLSYYSDNPTTVLATYSPNLPSGWYLSHTDPGRTVTVNGRFQCCGADDPNLYFMGNVIGYDPAADDDSCGCEYQFTCACTGQQTLVTPLSDPEPTEVIRLDAGCGTVDLYIMPYSAPQAPVANFTVAPSTGQAPLTVRFTDASSNFPTSWAWDFGDGSSGSIVENPTHAYMAPGNYDVTLTASNAVGSGSITKVAVVKVAQSTLVANFTGTPLTGTVPLSVTFTDASTGAPNFWAWDFGNGSSSSGGSGETTVGVTYTQPGTYGVSLYISDVTGNNSSRFKDSYITVADKSLLARDDTAVTNPDVDGHQVATIELTANDDIPVGWGGDYGYEILSGPSQGTATALSNSSVNYKCTNGFVGTDTFTYRLVYTGLRNDISPTASNTATVAVTVNA